MPGIRLICTHNGTFHADDVFAVALLKLLYPTAEVIRSRNQADFDRADVVVDVGGVFDPKLLKFDHHQEGRAGIRGNGVYYSAMGLVWQSFGLAWCEGDQQLYDRIDKSFVTYIDADDNGQNTYTVDKEFNVDPITIDDVVRLFRPAYGEPENFDAKFAEVVAWASTVLIQVRNKYKGKLKAASEFEDALKATPDPRYVVLDHYIPLDELVDDAGAELLYTVYPDISGSWRIKTVPKSKGSFESKKRLPVSWAGLSDEEFRVLTGIADADFCHNTGFIAGAKSKEGILKLLQLALAA